MKRWPTFSIRSKGRLLAGLALLTLLAAILSICLGAVFVPPDQIPAILSGQLAGTPACREPSAVCWPEWPWPFLEPSSRAF